MPPARVHKVILRLSKPSTPDTPAATPAAMPVPLPPLRLQQAPPTSPTPPPPLRPPNQLPSNVGLPIPNNSQHSVGTQENLLTYAPPHAGMFYPPVTSQRLVLLDLSVFFYLAFEDLLPSCAS
jgi:hypothetical protein